MTRKRWFRTAVVALAVVFIVGAGFALGRMTSDGGDQAAEAETQQLWTCPMHPDYIAEEPGDCPICGMDLVPVEGDTATAEAPDEPADHDDGEQLWTCPMHPEYIAEEPGACPICGMDLVPVEDAAEGQDGGEQAAMVEGLSTVHLSDAKRQLTGVTTVNAELREIEPKVRTVGIVKPDETEMRTVNAKIGGWVEKLFVDFEGAEIAAGEPMLTIYSPELYQTQQEYLTALAARQRLSSSGYAEVANTGRQMVEAAERRLRLWDIPQNTIDRLRRGGQPQRTMTLHAPVSGIVVKRMVETGAEIKPGMPLLHVVDLSRVWVEADIYEKDLDLVDEGQVVTVSFEAYPGEEWLGRIEQVYPYLEGATRTMKARLTLQNPDGRLKPEMYAEVVIEADDRSLLAVPEDTVINTGEREIVYVRVQEGVYEPRLVETNITSDGWTEILSGLSEGQPVVERGLFMIDSESRLRATVAASPSGAAADDDAEAAPTAGGHQH